MTKKTLFEALVGLANDLQAECDRLCFSPHEIALRTILARFDACIDQVLDEGVQEDDPHA